MENNLCAVILAAGEGKRMKSDNPKVMSKVLDKPMISWVVDSVKESGIKDICVVTGYKKEVLENYLTSNFKGISTVVQEERKGTAHAVSMAKNFLLEHKGGDVLILNGDAPFIDVNTIKRAYNLHLANDNCATVISAKLSNPSGYGRIIRKENGDMAAVVEDRDASKAQKEITEISSGAYWFNVESLLSVISNIKNNNSQGEYYLPDAVEILINQGKNVDASVSDNPDVVMGANDEEQLKQLNKIAEIKYI